MSDVVRAAGLRGLPALIDALGGDGTQQLDRFGIVAEDLDRDDVMISATAAARVLEESATALHCGDLGLRLAARQDASILGPLAIAIENAPTVGEAVETAQQYLFVHSPGMSVAPVEDPEGRPGVVGIRSSGTRVDLLPPQVADIGIGVVHRVLGLIAGRYGLRSVHLPHPPLAPVHSYTDFFGADVRFDQPVAVLRVPHTLPATTVNGNNEMLREVALEYMQSHYPPPGHEVSGQVRRLLGRWLGHEPTDLSSVARRMRLHPRTLQRRLAAEDAAFESLLDEVRRSAAHRLITLTDLPMTQVTTMVGMAEQSALTRAVRRWFGMSPRQLRSRHAGADR